MQVTETGMYLTTGKAIVKVQRSRVSGLLYGKELKLDGDKWKFEYAPGILKFIERKLTLEEAIVFGKEFGYCCVCGRLLTNKKSIELAIGPICRGYF
jgi:Family of unknown function (DUF6011)